MTAVYEWLAQVSAWWWPRLADHLWQTTLFALVMLAAAFVLKRGRARWRHAFCLIAAAKFVVPTALFVLLAQQIGADSLPFFRTAQQAQEQTQLLYGITEPAAAFVATYEVTVVAASTVRPQPAFLALTALWLSGSVTLLLICGIRRRRVLRALRRGQAVRSGREWRALERARESLRWQSRVGLVISPSQIEPAVWRVWRPTVVLPESIAGHLDDEELEAIMLHEVVHIQRRDNLIGNLQLVLCALFWFHPLVWFINRKLFDEREQACDEKVLAVCRAPEAYASSILKVVRFCFGWRVAGVTGAASGSNLRRRIENIMSTGNTKRSAGRASRLLASALLGLALLILVVAGIYTRPLTVSASTQEKAVVNENDAATASATEPDQKSSRQTRQMPPPPPPAEPTEPSDSPAVPQPPQPAQEAQPAQPVQPAQPAHPAQDAQPAQPPTPASPATTPPTPPDEATSSANKPDKNKPLKEKNKEKSKEKIKKGKLVEAPRPDYPDAIKAQKIEGTVAVVITIGDDGNVIDANADSGPKELYAVSEAAARRARFEPTLVDGKPAKVTGVVTYNFKLAE